MQISYDFYDEMCIALSELGDGDVRIPDWDIIREMERYDIVLTVGMFAYISENADAETDSEKKRLAYINKMLLDKVDFFEGAEPKAETGLVPEDAYFSMAELANRCMGFLQGKMPDTASVSKYLAPYIRYNFFLAYCFYLKAQKNEWQPKALLKKLMADHFELQWADKPVEITMTELERLKDDISTSRYGDEAWLPTVSDIYTYIVPNFDISYDFVLWLIQNAPEAKSKEEKESLSLLKKLFHKNVRILDKNGRRLETIWS